MDKLSIFISYSNKDIKIEEKIKQTLESLSEFEVFIAKQDIPAGKTWESYLLQKIRECSCFIPLITANAPHSLL